MSLRLTCLSSILAALFAPSPMLALDDPPLANWTVPSGTGAKLAPLTDIGTPGAFISIAPCRIMDTRGGAPLGGGPGPFTNGVTRDYDLNSAAAPCNGIPSGTTGYSLNVTVTNETANGYVSIYPTGNPPSPMVSTVNYRTASAVANATIVPCDSNGSVTVLNAGGSADVVLDINGYFLGWGGMNPGTGGFNITANNGSWAGHFLNTGGNGLLAQTSSPAANATALIGTAIPTSNPNVGVYGWAAGTGSAGLPPVAAQYSAGVHGATGNTTANVAGVFGETFSTGAQAAGVLGFTSQVNSQGGFFYNGGSGVISYLSYGTFGLSTNGTISGSSLTIYATPKNFVSPHPLDASKEIVYAAVEGPSADVFFRGTGRLVNGTALIEVPEHFRLTAREGSYMTTVTPVGARASLWIESEGPDGIVVKGVGDAAFHYVVWAERNETRDQQPVRENVHFLPREIAKLDMVKTLPARTLALLVKNGTLNPDGTFNEATARRLGWALPPPEAAPDPAPAAGIAKP